MISAIILAAGISSRFQSETPKQFHKLNGRELIDYSIQTFSDCDKIDRLIIVVPKEYHSVIQKKYPDSLVVEGGASRRESSFKGLQACPPETKKVLIHDAARALVEETIILRCIHALDDAQAVSIVVSVKDTVVESSNNIIVNMPDRSRLFLEQTPQGFHYSVIMDAHRNININTTDDIRLVKEMGVECKIVEGNEKNFKITTPNDYQIAEILIGENR